MQHKAGTVHPPKAPISEETTAQIAALVAGVVIVGVIVLVMRVMWIRIKYLWEYGEIPRIYLRGNADRRRRKN